MPGEVDADAACLFCRIVADEVPSTRVAEDEQTVAFMDINPASEGHLLVVPRAHSRDLGDIAPGDLTACVLVGQELARRAVANLGADGANLLTCWGEAAWQSVFHFHLHVVPRYAGDPERDRLSLPWTPTPGDPERIADVAARL